MNSPFIKQLRTGKVKQMGTENANDPLERPWKSGMFKKEQEGKILLTKTGLTSDEVADTKVHGGPEKALFAYPILHYFYWREELNVDIDAGAMGENLVMEEADEFTTYIGDTYRFGDAIIQVSQPRQPCWKPARRFKVLDFALRIQKSGKTGWYYRVIEEGKVEAGSSLELLERPYPEWSIAACNEVMHVNKSDLHLTYELASCPLLAENWRHRLQRRLRGQESSIEKRVYGPNKEK
ncbi:MOSC domain-containing protein [Pseudogracilibacillus sp. SE30717A]|uniref:MOSC domain-containing protein n=1 Tax=Pseudogracilibacillus sp. SE30717A TaxID=3098293 RepID=UPI00300E4F8A